MPWLIALLLAGFATGITLANDHVRDAPPAIYNAVMVVHPTHSIDHGLQRQSKADRLPHRRGTDPLSEVSSIEISDNRAVLRAEHGEIAFAIDQARGMTSIAKGYLVPQITVDLPGRKAIESAPILAHGR